MKKQLSLFISIVNKALLTQREVVKVPNSKLVISLLRVLHKEGFVVKYEAQQSFRIKLTLPLDLGIFSNITLAKGQNGYVICHNKKYKSLVSNNFLLLTNSKGIITEGERISQASGGKVLCILG